MLIPLTVGSATLMGFGGVLVGFIGGDWSFLFYAIVVHALWLVSAWVFIRLDP
jgi:hypothetical protein